MPRILVEAENHEREIVFWERVCADDFDAEHFRTCLAARLGWAVADAEELERAAPVARFERAQEPALT